jgi:diguanylate cyclase (GGDEF)-like protein/PAS domain S-box-containing protein
MPPDPAPPDPEALGLARAWARAIAGRTFVPMGTWEIEKLLLEPAQRLLAQLADTEPVPDTEPLPDTEPVPDKGQATEAVAREVGAALVAANLTDPVVLEAALTTLAAYVPIDHAITAAVAAGYARALRARTLIEQERLASAIIDAQAQTERTARQSEERFRAIFAGAAVGIGISDVDGRIVLVNQALADLLGYTPQQMQGLSVPEMTHPSDPPRMWQLYADMMRGEVDHVRLEKAYYRKDGGVVWTDLTSSLVRDDAGRPQFTVAMMTNMTERRDLQNRLRHQATHDPLTGLPNRTLFTERLAAVIRSAEPDSRLGICYLDLDGFKRINDTLGHEIGDRLLTMVAQRLGECAADRGHLAARMGGDEFVILVERSNGTEELAALAEAALGALATPVSVGRHRLRVSASIGVVERPALGADPADVLKSADVTLYRAKAEGRGRWALYDPYAVAAEVARYELSSALPDALERGEFFLVYQPIVGLPDRAMRGVEALVRWQHPRLGTLTPDRFIGLAEETGLIVPLGRWVLHDACREAASWHERFPGNDLFVSVNLAAAQTHEASLVGDVRQTLTETGLKASRLQLELTESALMTTSGEPLQALHTLSDHGVRVAIDDFGTGYSNLAYLRSLPVHALKLPRPFIEGLRGPGGPNDVDEQIVDALIRLAHAIDLTVTAEGVETQIQADRLAALGCDTAQGWYIGPPYSADDLIRLLE